MTLLMAGCSTGVETEPDSEDAEPGRTVAGESVEPGTPLRDGFSVVDGSRPLGPVLDVPSSVLEFNVNYEGAEPAGVAGVPGGRGRAEAGLG